MINISKIYKMKWKIFKNQKISRIHIIKLRIHFSLTQPNTYYYQNKKEIMVLSTKAWK